MNTFRKVALIIILTCLTYICLYPLAQFTSTSPGELTPFIPLVAVGGFAGAIINGIAMRYILTNRHLSRRLIITILVFGAAAVGFLIARYHITTATPCLTTAMSYQSTAHVNGGYTSACNQSDAYIPFTSQSFQVELAVVLSAVMLGLTLLVTSFSIHKKEVV